MTEVSIAVVSALLGVVVDRVVGFMLERKAEQEQLSRVRTLLALEIDRNLSEVRRIWGEITRHSEGREAEPSEVEKDHLLASKLVTLPWPRWTRTAWEGQAALIPAALTSSQITKIHELHTGLDALTSVRDTLARLEMEERQRTSGIAAQHGGVVPLHMAYGRFDTIAPVLWIRYVRTTTQLLTTGNILAGALDAPKRPVLPSPKD